VLCEAWAHKGAPNSAQNFKIMNGALKLVAVANLFPGTAARLILLLADQKAADPFRSGTWRVEALADIGVEAFVADLPEEVRAGIRAALVAQYR